MIASSETETNIETHSLCPQDTATDPPVFDHDDFQRRMMFNERLGYVIIEIFLNEMPEKLSSLKRSLRKRDQNAASMEAHSIKGCAAQIGATRLSLCAADIEKVIFEDVENAPARAAPLLKTLAAEYTRVQKVLETLSPLYSVHCPLSTVHCPLSAFRFPLFTVHCPLIPKPVNP